MDAPDAVPPDHLNVERADRRAVVRADGGTARDLDWGVHLTSGAPSLAKPGQPRKGRIEGPIGEPDRPQTFGTAMPRLTASRPPTASSQRLIEGLASMAGPSTGPRKVFAASIQG